MFVMSLYYTSPRGKMQCGDGAEMQVVVPLLHRSIMRATVCS